MTATTKVVFLAFALAALGVLVTVELVFPLAVFIGAFLAMTVAAFALGVWRGMRDWR